MITWENHGFTDNLVRLPIDFLDHLRIILQNIRQRFLGHNLFPEIIGLDSIWIGRIACTVIVPLVERQESGRLTAQPCTHFHLVVINRKMYRTSFEVKDRLLRVAVVHVLIDRIINISLVWTAGAIICFRGLFRFLYRIACFLVALAIILCILSFLVF